MNVRRLLTYATIALLAGAATCLAGDPWANTVRVEATAVDGTVHYGMGLVSDAEGHVLTAAAVVSGAGPVRLTAADGSTSTAEVLGSDPDSFLAGEGPAAFHLRLAEARPALELFLDEQLQLHGELVEGRARGVLCAEHKIERSQPTLGPGP